MSDITKVLLMNVVLATATVVFFFRAPPLSAAIGAVSGGSLFWVSRLRRRR